jgi:DNA-binding transcriptional regulator GbsR (MarR family)
MKGKSDLAPTDAIAVDDGEADHIETWKDETQGIDRVISVALSVEQPRTAEWIAEEAHVSEGTARSHLERLVELRILSAVKKRGATTYFRDSAYQKFRQVSKFVEKYDPSELEEVTVQTKQTLEELREEFDVESPGELREKATDPSTDSRDARRYFERASEWDQHLRTLSITQEALERYNEFSTDTADHTTLSA